MTNVEIVWSIHVFFFKPAKIPKAIPKGTETTTEITLGRITSTLGEQHLTIKELAQQLPDINEEFLIATVRSMLDRGHLRMDPTFQLYIEKPRLAGLSGQPQ